MYEIVTTKKQNKSLYTVVYEYGRLNLPLMQSRNQKDCINYILSQAEEVKEYDKVEAKQALKICLREMYKKNSNPD